MMIKSVDRIKIESMLLLSSHSVLDLQRPRPSTDHELSNRKTCQYMDS